MNTCKNPLKLSWVDSQYKVNKPYDQSGEYVDKAIVIELLDSLTEIIAITDRNHIVWDKAKLAIKNAELE